MKYILGISACILISSIAEAEEKTLTDPFDLSASTTKVDELGIVTKPEVDLLEAKATELFRTNNCKEALPVLDELSKKSNWLANLISANLKPYYGASYDDKKDYPYNKIKPLAVFETMSNEYKRKRNIAFAMQGECLLKIGDKKAAVPVILKALDLLGLKEEVWWERSRNNLNSVIKVEAK